MKRSILPLLLLTLSNLVPTAAAEAAPRRCFGREATLTGTSGDDVIRGTQGRDVIVALGGGDRVYSGDGEDLVCAGAGHDLVRSGARTDLVRGASGRDRIYLGSSIMCIPSCGGPGEAYGGRGRDLLTTFGPARLSGGPGDDRLVGAWASDYLMGGRGDDRLQGGLGRSDTVSFTGSARGVTVDLERGFARGMGTDTIRDVERVVASRFDDTVRGSEARNYIATGKGDDRIAGRAGPDYLEAGGGDDLLRGGDGRDRLFGASGADGVYGGDGRDYSDLVSHGMGVRVDLLAGTSEGSDSEILQDVEDVKTTSRRDIVMGSEDANRIETLVGDDVVDARGGWDTIAPGWGDNTVDGGSGRDQASYEDQVVADLTQDAAVHGDYGDYADVLTRIESLRGSNYDDSLTGDDGRNSLQGGSGHDSIDGLGEDDRIWGGAIYQGHSCVNTDVIAIFWDGEDTINGGGGDDTIRGGSAFRGRSDCSETEDEGDRISGDAGNDSLFGDQGGDLLNGGADTDTLNGGEGEDACIAGETVRSCERP